MIKSKMLIMFLLAVLIPVGINFATRAAGKAEKIPTGQEIAQKAKTVEMLKTFFKGESAEKPQNNVVSSKPAAIEEIFIPEPDTIANYYIDLPSKH